MSRARNHEQTVSIDFTVTMIRSTQEAAAYACQAYHKFTSLNLRSFNFFASH